MTVEYQQASDVRRMSALNERRGRPPLGHAPLDLIDQARACLAEAASSTLATDRFAAAHLSALRAAAAVLAARARPVNPRRTGRTGRRGHGPRNVWDLLPVVAPEFAEWAAFFAANAGKRSAAQAGLPGSVSVREADDLLRQADEFLGLVCVALGLPYQEPLDVYVPSGLRTVPHPREA
ncbi:SAV_6107 family HEPN domain-containing protein [Haloactinopolyspora sp.]|uniref:SAV_6107 family HEPN domain-containing protein n=1 Tax=Haloactinopolyspora sp. TaxID=1966353 RepID=UPI002634C615|nr:SAV_6107 family HEPN domain-containing protein [Haloactinopolyspora sp.]